MERIGVAAWMLTAVIAVACCSCSLGISFGEWRMQKQAIESNAGHWTCDPETGVKVFEWRK